LFVEDLAHGGAGQPLSDEQTQAIWRLPNHLDTGGYADYHSSAG
jgi:hypothetical protein